AHERGVLVTERHVDARAHAAALLGRRDQRRALLDRGAQRLAERRMQNRGGVLELAGLADDRGLAVALDLAGLYPERGHGALAQQAAELLADLDQHVEIGLEASGARVLDHRERARLARRRRDLSPHLLVRLLD